MHKINANQNIALIIFDHSGIHIFLILQDLTNQETNFIRHGVNAY